ncbi:hypothetical protein QZM91_24165 [Burkholderia multivorans]|uniref:hypothetical protein n=1 Tax=Burkholderia multivorans TaxID=87883 RepID=UPI00201986DC|nr:hypothetical protein [Burkholderia multivorans]MCO1358852.1 hypothetical protein [Burkholderia multivorans]MCO1418680.1 hypothetical protein [Burkholderia multivorans]MDN7970649.1 hypothetical protein [Burkholderia multivorans]UQO98103.1 hypothetical protein L0Z41_20825 [Burkholderia multivorans]
MATFATKTIEASLKADRTLSPADVNALAPVREQAWDAVSDVRRRALAAESILDKSSLNRASDEYLSSAANVFAKISERDALLRNLALNRDVMAAAQRDLDTAATGPTNAYANNLMRAAQSEEARALGDIAATTRQLRLALTDLSTKRAELTRELGNIGLPDDELRAAADRYSAAAAN